MPSNIVPPAPTASWKSSESLPASGVKTVPSLTPAAPAAPLDAAFLARSYRSILWFGALLTALLYGSLAAKTTAAAPIAVSFGSGVLLAILLLKSQELFVRRILRPRAETNGLKLPYDGPDRFLPLWISLPLKYAFVVIFMRHGLKAHWILAMPFATGFGVIQLVITAKVIGRLLQTRIGTVRTAYIENHQSHA